VLQVGPIPTLMPLESKRRQNTYCCYAYRLYFVTCYMYMSSLRHIHDPVLSSLKMKGIRLFLTRLCCDRCCGATEHTMLSTTAMPSAEILHWCYSLSHSVSCLFDIHCCDCCDLSRYVGAECLSVLLHFVDINHGLP
jgi:hypothetical protein